MIGIETIIEADAWERMTPGAEALAARCFETARARDPALSGSVALLLADDAAVRDLNRRFRGKDAATNVLSFPSGEAAPAFLGDVAVAYETAEREARAKGVALAEHAAHLIVHGLLHLVGYDHHEADEADRMEALESDILDALGVYNPYRNEELAG